MDKKFIIMKTIYLIRYSESIKANYINYFDEIDEQNKNEKNIFKCDW